MQGAGSIRVCDSQGLKLYPSPLDEGTSRIVSLLGIQCRYHIAHKQITPLLLSGIVSLLSVVFVCVDFQKLPTVFLAQTIQ